MIEDANLMYRHCVNNREQQFSCPFDVSVSAETNSKVEVNDPVIIEKADLERWPVYQL